ncbi:DUF368 domain-containing protein [Marinomonas agarivorans]|nr:DUF368 domain-containing protein [Marinomonas agarivorans]
MIKWLKIYFGGVFMGAADIVPGVSGGTIAFILGFYERLINALSGVNKKSFSLLLRGDIKGLWRHFDLAFLLTLALGIFTSVLLLASIISYLLTEYALYLWGFFFGLLLASSYLLFKELDNINFTTVTFLCGGILLGYLISQLTPTGGSGAYYMVFLAGMIAIMAMLLPGISGSFILLMLGMYDVILLAINQFQFVTLAVFCVGALFGLLLFSKVLKYILQHFHQVTMAFLVGIIIGSLVKVWPWRQASEWYTLNDKLVPLQEHLVWPWDLANYQLLPDIIYPLFCLFFGFVLILFFSYILIQKK